MVTYISGFIVNYTYQGVFLHNKISDGVHLDLCISVYNEGVGVADKLAIWERLEGLEELGIY